MNAKKGVIFLVTAGKSKILMMMVGILLLLTFSTLSYGQEREGFPEWWDQLDPADQQWAQAAQVGPYATQGVDWGEIEQLARKEGKIVIYSQSSRWKKSAKTFGKKYPEIKVEGHDLYVYTLMSRWESEHKAGVHNVDVIFADDESTMINEFLVPPLKMIWNFVTPTVRKTWVDQRFYDPLLIIRATLQPIFYNPGTYDRPPINNLWDLTKPEWSRRILIMDPTVDPFALNWLTTIIQHSDELEEAYRVAFGKKLVLDPGIPDAGYQWLKDLIENRPVTVASDDEVAEGVGAEGSKHIGLAAFYSKYRWTLKGRVNIYPIHDIKPFAGTQTFTYFGISNRAPHPNAAKLWIREMIGTEEDPIGTFWPWHVPGDFKPRAGLPPSKGMPEKATLEKLAPKYRPNDPLFIYKEGPKVRDFWLAHYRA